MRVFLYLKFVSNTMIQKKEYKLVSSSVDTISSDVEHFLNDQKISKETIIKNRLMLEEILLQWIDAKISHTIQIVISKKRKQTTISLECMGLPCNIFEQNDDEKSILLKQLLKSLGQYPSYSYVNGKNTVQLIIPAVEKNKLIRIGISAFFAIAVGLLLKLALGENLCSSILSSFVDPIYSAAFRILGLIAGPLILLSVIWGIYGIGDSSALNLIGKKIIKTFAIIMFAIGFSVGSLFPLFNLNFQSVATSESSFKTIFDMVLDVIPSNINQPFNTGNTLQMIFCAIVFGLAIVYLNKNISYIPCLIEELNRIVQYIMSVFCNLMPGLVFIIFLRLILNGTFYIFSSIWKLFVSFIGTALIICSIFTFVTSFRNKVKPSTLIKKNLSTFLIALSTASSSAAFTCNVDTCENKFGIDKNLTSFGIPLGMVMFKTTTVAYYVLACFFFAKQFDIVISANWIISTCFISAMLAIATPPVPGGSAAAYTMLFARLGLPTDALAIALAIDVIFDFIKTAANMYNLPLFLIGIGSRLGKVNLDVLRKE